MTTGDDDDNGDGDATAMMVAIAKFDLCGPYDVDVAGCC